MRMFNEIAGRFCHCHPQGNPMKPTAPLAACLMALVGCTSTLAANNPPVAMAQLGPGPTYVPHVPPKGRLGGIGYVFLRHPI